MQRGFAAMPLMFYGEVNIIHKVVYIILSLVLFIYHPKTAH